LTVKVFDYNRLQVTLFLAGPSGSRLDEIRSRLDPVMAARIGSHVTVLRRVPDPDAVVTLLERAPRPRACRLKLGGVDRAPASDGGGVYLHIADPFGDLAHLRETLRPGCGGHPDAVQEFAHVTLVHPRTTTPDHRNKAWTALQDWEFVEDVTILAVSLIGETNRVWEQVASFDLDPV
jgi:hypothetical protein